MQEPNNRVTPAALAAALRCSAAEDLAERNCEGCPYYVTEDVADDLVDQLGDTWTYCDVDRMARDAADMIEMTPGGTPITACVSKEQVIEWFRPYEHADKDIPYDVLAADIRDMPTVNVAPVEDCFVLRPGKDPAARIAMEAYAKATENKALAEDILAAIGDSGRVAVLPVRPVLSAVISSMLYIIDDGEIYEDALCSALVGMSETGETNVIYETLYDLMSFEQKDVGKTVFLSREEAEKALKEGEAK